MSSFKEKIYEIILQNNLGGSRSSLLRGLGAISSFDKKNMGQAIDELIQEGKLVEQKRGKEVKIFLAKSVGGIRGKIHGNAKGFAFLIRDDGGEDIFIPARRLNGAMHQDTVLVKVTSSSQEKNSSEGEVIAILERGIKKVVGIFYTSRTYGFVVPDDAKISKDIFIPMGKFLTAQNGQKVVAQINVYPADERNPEGEIIEVLGEINERGMDILSIIRANNLYEEFAPDVLAAAKKAPQRVSEEEIKGRRDLRNDLIITIDGSDAKDLDDAVSVRANADGTYNLGVHIADVTHYVKPNTPLDKEAFNRGTSVYFPDRVLPMLPRELSNGICSLNPHEDRLTLSVFMDIDTNGRVVRSEIIKSVINSKARMTYTDVTKILQGDKELCKKYDYLVAMLHEMERLMNILNEKRRLRGSIDFEIPESKIILDDQGKVKDIMPYPREVSNRIIEEFMLITNETVAEHMYYLEEMPFVYRVHEVPSEEKTEVMLDFAEGLGLTFKKSNDGLVHPKTVQSILAQAEGKPIYSVINKVMLRSMQKARYHHENIGHFGLAAKFYCHFTSPIRRYPDLAIHRIIKDYLDNGLKNAQKYVNFVASVSVKSSERERLAENAEREVDNLKKAEYMSQHLGEIFEGVISGVTDFGIFVELANTCEGMVRLDNLPQDYYDYQEKKFALVGKQHIYRLGDPAKVIVIGTDLENKRAEFALVDDDGELISQRITATPKEKVIRRKTKTQYSAPDYSDKKTLKKSSGSGAKFKSRKSSSKSKSGSRKPKDFRR